MVNKSIFSRLKRLFSNDIIIRNVGRNRIRTIDINSIQRSGKIATNSMDDRFNRIFATGSPTSLYGKQFNLNYQYLRPQLYSEYDTMDQDAIIATALDIVADESTLKNDLGETLQIRSSNKDIQDKLYNLFYDILNIEFNLWSWVRQMCKFGDFFLKLEIAEKFGVYNIIPYTAFHIERQEGYDKDNPADVRFRFDPDGNISTGYARGYVSPKDSKTGTFFDNYEMAHFRLISDVNYLPYGRSYIEPARKLFKQYSLMEDAMLIHRITRAPEKRIFYINVGAIPPNEVDAFMEKTISNMKRTPHQDPETGDYNLKYNIQNLLEDFYIPQRGNDNSTRIETIKGLEYTGIDDVIYLRDKLFAALKVPKAFMGYDENLEGKATLAAQDIRFARTINRIQKIIISELNKIAFVHLTTLGVNENELINFTLELTTPSIIYDQEKIELLKSKAELSQTLLDQKLIPSDWIYDHIYHFSEDEYEEYRALVREDSQRNFRNHQIQEEGNDPQETGKSYGTPHDLASLYGKGRTASDPSNVPDGYEEEDLGRPQDTITKRNKQEDNFGKDRLGVDRMKGKDHNEGDGIFPKTKKGPLALEGTVRSFYKNKKMLINYSKKQLIFETNPNQLSLLDESQLEE